MTLGTVEKDPAARIDYPLDWSKWLVGADTIVTSTWVTFEGDGITPSVALDVDDSSNTTTGTVVWLTGGIAGKRYFVTNHVVTAQGREDDRSFTVKCKER